MTRAKTKAEREAAKHERAQAKATARALALLKTQKRKEEREALTKLRRELALTGLQHVPILDLVRAALVSRKWALDPDPSTNARDEPLEFIHPHTSERLCWTDALLAHYYDVESW